MCAYPIPQGKENDKKKIKNRQKTMQLYIIVHDGYCKGINGICYMDQVST